MNYKKMSENELEVLLKNKVDSENQIKTEVLYLLSEVERRRLYSKSYPSLFMYCVKVLKYSNGYAQRRIDAMRAIKLVPEIETKLQTGELNLTTVGLAQTFFRAEVRKDIFKKLETKTELKVILESKTVEKLDKLKALLSHKYPHLKDSELMNIMAEICLEKLDPMRKIERSHFKSKPKVSKNSIATTVAVSKPAQNSRYILSHVRRAVWQSDQGQYVYINKQTGEMCGSLHFLEFKHSMPFAFRETTSSQNLKLLCRTHNQRTAINTFGFQKIEKYLNK